MESHFENVSSTLDPSPPQHRFADYVEIIVLVVMLVAGCPLNLLSLVRSVERFDRSPDRSGQVSLSNEFRPRRFSRTLSQSIRNSKSSRVFALIIHLTVANLMILLIYGLSQICWLITYSWNAADWVCRVVKFLQALCFYGTSNLMVAVAIERLYVAANVDQPGSWGGSKGEHPFMKMSPWISWTLAILSSVPQLFLWRTYAPYENSNWRQCVDIWTAQGGAENRLANNLSERTYMGVHLTLVFWLPVSIIIACYTMIIARLSSRLRRNYRDLIESKRQGNVVVFRQRAEQWHRASCCSADNPPNNPPNNDDQGERRQSVVLLMEMPIIVESLRVFSRPKENRSTLINDHSSAILFTTLTRARRSAVTKMTRVLVAYVLCWAPYNVMALWRYIDPNQYMHYAMEFLYNFIVLNAVINPLIYGC